jgi:hypothetical protein
MRSARVAALASVLVVIALAPSRPRAAQRTADPAVAELLAAAGRYVAAYESAFGAVVAEETYQQSTNGPATTANRAPNGASRRRTAGDVLLFSSGGAGWMAFRDVYVIDNDELPTPKGRLAALAANPTHDALAEAMRATEANEKHAIGTIPRAPAIPMAALVYLRATRQPFSVFEFDGVKTVDGVRAAVLKYSQRPHARTTDADDFAITGRFWIEPDTGRVVQTALTISSVDYENNVEVQYASRPGIEFWVPVRMFEAYTLALPSRGASSSGAYGSATKAYVDGLTTYQAFQRFELKPALIIR